MALQNLILILGVGVIAYCYASPLPAEKRGTGPYSGAPEAPQNNGFGFGGGGLGAAAGLGGFGRASAGLGNFQVDERTNPFSPWGAFASIGGGPNGGGLGAGCTGLTCGVQLGDFSLNTRQLLDAVVNRRNGYPTTNPNALAKDEKNVLDDPRIPRYASYYPFHPFHAGKYPGVGHFNNYGPFPSAAGGLEPYGLLQNPLNALSKIQQLSQAQLQQAQVQQQQKQQNIADFARFGSNGSAGFGPNESFGNPSGLGPQESIGNGPSLFGPQAGIGNGFDPTQQGTGTGLTFGPGFEGLGNGPSGFGQQEGITNGPFGPQEGIRKGPFGLIPFGGPEATGKLGGKPFFQSTSVFVDREGKVTTIEKSTGAPDKITTGKIGGPGGFDGIFAASGTKVEPDGTVSSFRKVGSLKK